jgi:hypothetical protein
MSIYIIKHKNDFLGVYNKLDSALEFIYSLLNCKLIGQYDKILINNYKLNSNILLNEFDVDLKYIITKKNKINYDKWKIEEITDKSKIDEKYEDDSLNSTTLSEENLISEESIISNGCHELRTSEEDRLRIKNRENIIKQTELGQEKINIVHQINLLKEKKKKIEEDDALFDADLKLYIKFKSLKETNPLFFTLPFMFEEKYKVFELIEEKNLLSLDGFNKYYKPIKMKTSYYTLFNNTESDDDSDSDANIDSNNESSEVTEIFSNVEIDDLLTIIKN